MMGFYFKLNFEKAQVMAHSVDEKRLCNFISSASRLHVSAELMNEMRALFDLKFSNEKKPDDKQLLGYWQKETDLIIRAWILGDIDHAVALQRLSLLKNQIRHSSFENHISKQSISALLSSAWNLVDSADYEEKTRDREKTAPAPLVLYRP